MSDVVFFFVMVPIFILMLLPFVLAIFSHKDADYEKYPYM